VLKLYEFECSNCRIVKEELLDIPPMLASIQCNRCGGLMEYIVIGGKSHVFKPLWHPHLGHSPVYIDSWRKFKKELRTRELRSELE
jgi:hypothetical protein